MTGTAAQTPVMDVTEIPAEPQVFQSGTLSTGLELVCTAVRADRHLPSERYRSGSVSAPYSERTAGMALQPC